MMFNKKDNKIDVTASINRIENAVYQSIKKYGFTRHGRTLHRFVSGDISQIISFQCGQAYRNETHLMWVNIGIRVPECFERKFDFVNDKKYYHEYECNIRSRLGAVKRKNPNRVKTYDLRKDIDKITAQITDEIIQDVLPVFDVLSSRESILKYRRDYPYFDTMFSHLILLEEAMIYGHLGDIEQAKKLFDQYYDNAVHHVINPNHIEYLDKLAKELELR